MKPKTPNTPKARQDDQAEAAAERAQAALDNVREGYGEMTPLSPRRATPDATPHGQKPEKQREREALGRPSRRDTR
jgi:hypothetical protein